MLSTCLNGEILDFCVFVVEKLTIPHGAPRQRLVGGALNAIGAWTRTCLPSAAGVDVLSLSFS